jgi:hypothetical protein
VREPFAKRTQVAHQKCISFAEEHFHESRWREFSRMISRSRDSRDVALTCPYFVSMGEGGPVERRVKIVLRDLDVLRCAHEAPCANERACQEGVRRSFEKMLEVRLLELAEDLEGLNC